MKLVSRSLFSPALSSRKQTDDSVSNEKALPEELAADHMKG
jgi:hypothetical protein